MAGVTADLFSLARIASLEDAHEVGVLALRLGLAAAGNGVGDVLAVDGENFHAGQVGEVGAVGVGGAGHIGRGRGGLGGRGAGVAHVRHGRGGAEGGGRGGAGRGGVHRVVLEVLAGLGGVLKEFDGDDRSLLLNGAGTGHIGVDEIVKILGTDSGQPCERCSQKGLKDGEALQSGAASARHGRHFNSVTGESGR